VQVAERGVERRQDLRPGAEARRERGGRPGRLVAPAAALEAPHVGVTEAVDGLQRIAHHEHVAAVEAVEERELQRVRVLELVDHDPREPRGVVLGDRGLGREQIARDELEVGEVQDGALALGGGVRVGVAAEQLVDQRQRLERAGVAAGLREGVECRAVALVRRRRELGHAARLGVEGGEHHTAGRGAVRIQQLQAAAHRLARAVDRGQRPRRGQVRLRRAGRRGELRAGCPEVGRPRRGERGPRLPAAAQGLVDVAHDGAQAVGPVGRDELERRRALVAQEAGEGRVERAAAQRPGARVVEDGEARVQAGRDRVPAQHAGAEPVDGGDPGGLGVARVLAAPELEESLTDTGAQLTGRLVGERDGQDLLGAQAVLRHAAHEALDEDRRLAGARAGADQERTVTPGDGQRLLGRERPRARAQDRRARLGLQGHTAPPRQMDGCAQPPP
jgi:hypothetical protein